jgi:phosphatidylserine/phosphatidylglycerophosphate/cardiolipin synthase-like enzyme
MVHWFMEQCAKSEGSMKLFRSWVASVLLQLPTTFFVNAMECQVDAKFSSEGSVGRTVTEAIQQTKSRLTLALYGFDNSDLAYELITLAKKNITVRLKVDANRSSGKKITSLIERLRAGGVQVNTVTPYGRNHNKFAVIDGTTVVTGSYNWTVKSESNWENILLLKCPELAKTYEREWEKIK